MGAQVAKKRRKRRQFTDEYRAEVVELVRSSDKSIGQIARELDLTETAVRAWVQKAEGASTTKAATTESELSTENRELRKRIKELEMERAILKKAAAFFAKEST
jgi:transposase